MPDFPAIYLKSRWVIKSGRRWSEPIGGLIDVEEIMQAWADFCSGKHVGRLHSSLASSAARR